MNLGTINLGPIVVTARKIPENVQKVPFGITVVTAQDRREGHVENSQDLSRDVPGFNFTDSGLAFSNLLNIRGVGSSSALIEPSVTYYVDGIPIPPRVFDQRFLDVSQIDVLKGPQGTLFGLNAQAGVIDIHTADPPATFSGEVGAEFSSYGGRQLTFNVGGPLSDTVSAILSGQLYGYGGDISNYTFNRNGSVVSSNRNVRAEMLGAIASKIVITPNADTKITISANYRHDHQHPTTGVWMGDIDSPRNAYNQIPSSTIETEGLGVTVEHDFDWATLTTITGFEHYDLGLDADILDGFIAHAQTGDPPYAFQTAETNLRAISEHDAQLTQEARFNGVTENGIRWVAGLSGLYSDFNSTTDITSTAMANGAYTGKITTANGAAFGEVTIPITDRLRLIAGLRANYEDKAFNGLFLGRPGPVVARAYFDQTGNTSYAFMTGRTGLSYDLTPDLTAYATIARGEKTGGYLFYNQYAAMGIPLNPYKSATTWSYETGLRGKPLVDWLEINTSIFLNETRNEQLFTYNPVAGVFSVQNANTQTYGAEFGAKARATQNLSFSGNLALLRAEITSGTVRGNTVPYAPPVAVTFASEYRHDLAFGNIDGSAFGRAEYQYVGSREIDPANSLKLGGYSLVNLRAGWQTNSFDVYAYVENLFNKTYALSAFESGTSTSGQPVFAGIPGIPRTIGVGARFRF